MNEMQPSSERRVAERTLTPTTAHEPMKKRGERMAFPENASEGFRLLTEEVRLKERISTLEDLRLMSQPGEGLKSIEDEIRDKEDELKVTTTELAKFSDKHAVEVAFAEMLQEPIRAVDKAKAEKIAATVSEKDRLEEASYVLEGELRLKDKHAQAEIGEMQATLKMTHEARLAAWQQLSDLDPARFQAAAVREISEAADNAKIDAIRASINPFAK